MKASSALFVSFLIFAFGFSNVISQPSTDSCSSGLNLRDLPFDTSSFSCRPVWISQDFVLRYKQTESNVWSFVLSAPNQNGYIGMGFSPTGNMVGSSAVVGWVGNDGTAIMKKYYLGGQTPSQVKPNEGNLQVGNLSSVVTASSRIYMAYQLINIDMPESRLIYAVGPPGRLPPSTTFTLFQHSDQISTTLNYATGQIQKKTPYANLRRSHGLLNMFGWGILMPIGAMLARYMRQWDPIWFYSHVTIQSLGFAVGLSGVISGLVLNDRLQNNVNKHKGLGIVILTLGCLQIIAFLARPDKASKLRKYWNWYHYTVGRLLIFLAAVNIFYGIHLAKAGTAWNAGYAIVLVVLFVVGTILELRMWMKK